MVSDKRRGSAGGSGRRASNRFGAAGTSLGFQYQIRYALLRLLRAEPGDSITMEKTDDIALERDDATGEWVQTKHHGGATTLGDTSNDLWKTLRNWSSHMLDGSLDPRRQTLILVTTSAIKGGTAASLLCPKESGTRYVKKSLDILAEAARRSRDALIKNHYAEFAKLGRNKQLDLLESVTILGSEPNIEEISESIKKELRLVSPQGKLGEFTERVEGWWFNRAIESMRNETPVSLADLKARIDDIRNQFTAESLPLDFAATPLSANEQAATKTFIKQLEIINVSDSRQKAARLDYYRAYKQRSRWTTDELAPIEELENYDKRLYDQWFDLFYRMKEDLADYKDEETLRNKGWVHYNATIDKDVRIRPNVSDPYVMRGSLHMMADKLKIGWHPNYDAMLAPRPAGAGVAG